MLEGHFVDDSLARVYADPDHPVFAVWSYIRGFTAPVFLTVTGLIFVFLLLRNQEPSYFGNIRIRKGFKRVIELIFWGYLVQWYAFHVLECIAFGILFILIIYGMYKLIKVIPLWFLFFLAGITAFGLYTYIRDHHGGTTFIEDGLLDFYHYTRKIYPEGVSWFPIVPWVGFTMFGAMIGALLHDLKHHVRTWYFPTIMFATGALFYFFPKDVLLFVDDAISYVLPAVKGSIAALDWLYLKMGMVLMELSFLVYIDVAFGDRIRSNSLFLKIGQNTLTIYVLHMILLYGSIFGFGIKDYCYKALGPWEVAIGAVLFVLFFVILIKYIDWIREILSFILNPIRNVFNRIFFIRT